MYQELLQSIGEEMASFLVAPITDLWHRELTLKASAHPVIDTFRLTPVLFHAGITIGLVALEGLSALLDNLDGHGEFCDEREICQ